MQFHKSLTISGLPNVGMQAKAPDAQLKKGFQIDKDSCVSAR
jgi:hypothetical protein